MISFFEFAQFINEEILKQIHLQNAIHRTGIDPNIFQMAKKVMTINDFLENPPAEAQGAYALGLTKATGDIYFRIAKAFNMVHWQDAYKQAFGSKWWDKTNNPDITHQFMNKIVQNERPIVFFLPDEVLKTAEGQRYTREEIEYLMQNSNQLKNVIFVLGAYNVIDPEDYDKMIAHDEEGWPRELKDQEKLTQDVLKNPRLHQKPGRPY